MDDPVIQNRILSLAPEYQEFIMSDFISSASHELAEVGSLSEQQRVILSNGLLLYMLYFLSYDDLVQFLVDNDFVPLQASAIVSAYTNVLPPEFVEGHDDVVLDLTSESESGDQIDTPPQNYSQPVAPIAPVMPVADMYRSTQDAVLNPNPQNDGARWGQV